MIEMIDTVFLEKFKLRMEEDYQTLNDPIDSILETLISIGFINVRYWMLCDDNVDDRECFILARAMGEDLLESKYGYEIKITSCSIFNDPQKKTTDSVDSTRKVSISQHTLKELNLIAETKRINDELGLSDSYFVHIPISCHGIIHGQLSCSLRSYNKKLSASKLGALSIIGMMFGDYKLLHAQKKLSIAKDEFSKIENELVEKRNNRETLKEITKLIQSLVGAEHCASFDLNWYDGQLEKITHYIHSKANNYVNELPESYSIGENLTGKAYNYDKYQFIYSLNKLMEKEPNLVNRTSLDYHNNQNEDLSSDACVAYGLVGKREHKGLIRVYNKVGDNRIPFDKFELDSLKYACEYFSKAFDDINTYYQLDRLQTFATQITDNFTAIEKICFLAEQSLVDDWISEIIIYGRLTSEKYTTLFYRSYEGNNYRKKRQKETSFLLKCLKQKSVKWVSLSDGDRSNSIDYYLEKHLADKEYCGLLVIPNDFGNFKGAMGIPLKIKPIFENDGFYLSELHLSSIKAYSAIILKL